MPGQATFPIEDAPRPSAIIVQQGKVLDFIDGTTQRKETPEEYVRQEIAKSLVREYGYAKRDIAVEFTLRLGTRYPRADLVIFPGGVEHRQENAHIIVECKAPTAKETDSKEGIGQLHSYMAACPNVLYGTWTNGKDRFCFRRVVTDGKINFEEVLDIPEHGQERDAEDRPRFDQLKPAKSDALLFAFRRCHDYIAGNQGMQPAEAFWQLLRVIFCKIQDERGDEIQFYAAGTERQGLVGAARVKARVTKLFEEVKGDYPLIFRPGDEIDLNDAVLAYIVVQLQKFSLLESDVDVKGRAYEQIVGSVSARDRGQFFTPRNVCRMAVEMLNPGEKQLVLDPACGTGGFLMTVLNHVSETIRTAERKKLGDDVTRLEIAVRERSKRFAEKFIVGIDFDLSLVKASKMNMVMNNDGSGSLYQANSLENAAVWVEELRERKLLGKVDLLFTNPPFGSKIPVDSPAILERYDLGHAWSYDAASDRWTKTANVQKSQPPEILFIERCVRFLKPGIGRAAIVVPDGILGSPGLGYVREWILRNTRILASIDLHPDTFQPFVSVQTSVLVLQRKTDEQVALEAAAGQMNDYQVFMAVANHIGHDKRGNTTYVRDRRGNEIVEEFTEHVKEYQDGVPVYRQQQTQRKVVDDNTLQIAQEFRKWLSEQD